MAGLFGSTPYTGQQAMLSPTLGILGAALKDAGASFSGRGDNNSLQGFNGLLQQNQARQQLMAGLTSTDPAVRQQAYAQAAMLGIDTKPIQAAQVSQATPALLAAMRPSSQEIVAPAAKATLPNGINLDLPASPTGNIVNTPGASLQDAVSGLAEKYPELATQYAPDIIKQSIENQNKQVTTLTPQETVAAGFRPDAVVQQDVFGNLKVAQAGDVPSQAKLDAEIWLKNHDPHLAIDRGNLDIARQNLELKKGGALDDDTVQFMANQILAGDKSPFQNLGRGQQGAQNIVRLRQAVSQLARTRGLGGSDLAALNAEFAGLQAGERTLGTRTANVEMAASEVQQLAPLALAASNAVNRTQYPSLNKVQLAVQQGTGDENVIRLNQAVNGLVNTYSRAISPSGTPTVSDKEHAREILEAAYSKGQFNAAVDQMQKEIAAARKSPASVRGEFRGAISGRSPEVAAVPDAIGMPSALPSTQALPRIQAPTVGKIRTYNPATGKLE